MADEHDDKTEQPSDRRRSEVRERGNVAKSIDLNTAASILAAASALHFLGGEAVMSLIELLRRFLAGPAWTQVEPKMLFAEFWKIGELVLKGIGPFLALMLVSSVAVNLAQVGFLLSTEALQPNFSRINPLEGFKRIFSIQALVKLAASLLKLTVLTAIAAGFIAAQLPAFLRGTDLETMQICRQIGQSLISLSFQLAIALAILAILDYGFQLWKFEDREDG